MIGFAAFVMTLVVGILILVGGLNLISGRGEKAVPPVDDERLSRIESALSALESRLDSLQEQQRFLERLLADRPAPKSLEAGEPEREEAAAEPGSDESSHGVDSILFDTDAGEEAGDR